MKKMTVKNVVTPKAISINRGSKKPIKNNKADTDQATKNRLVKNKSLKK